MAPHAKFLAFLACLLSQAAVMLRPGLCAMPCCDDLPVVAAAVAAAADDCRACCTPDSAPKAPAERTPNCCGQCRPMVSTDPAPVVGAGHAAPVWLAMPNPVVAADVSTGRAGPLPRATAPPWDPLRHIRCVRLLV